MAAILAERAQSKDGDKRKVTQGIEALASRSKTLQKEVEVLQTEISQLKEAQNRT